MSKQPPPAPTARAVGPCLTLIQTSRTPRHWKFTQDHRTTWPTPRQKKKDNRLVLSKLPFKSSIVMPILVPVGFVYKHGSPCSICRIKGTLRFWFGSNCLPGISFAYLYAYSKKSFGYFNYLIGYLRKYAALISLMLSVH